MEKIDKLFLIFELQIPFAIFKIVFQDGKPLRFYKGNLPIFLGKFNFLQENLIIFLQKLSYLTVKTVNFPVKVGGFSRKYRPLSLKNRRKSLETFQEKIFKSEFNYKFLNN